MKSPLLLLALAFAFGLSGPSFAQAPKSGEKSGDKKAPAPKTPGDLAYDAFVKVRSEQGKMNQDRFHRVINAGLAYLTEFPTHGRVNDVIRDLAFFGGNIEKAQAALRTSYSSLLKLEVTNHRYKDGLSDPAKAAIAGLDAAVADYDAREASNADNLNTLREKTDALMELPGGNRFVLERERSYTHLLLLTSNSPQRAEAHLKKLLEHKEKSVVTMATEELNIIEVRKEPYALKFTGMDGKPTDFAQLRGKVVGLYFWSSTNKGSTDRLEQLRQLASDYRKRGFELVTVSYDKEEDRAKLEKFIKDNRLTAPVYFDGKGAKNDFSPKLNANNVPRLYLFDQKGILQTTLAGSPVSAVTPNWSQNQVEGKVKQLLGIK